MKGKKDNSEFVVIITFAILIFVLVVMLVFTQNGFFNFNGEQVCAPNIPGKVFTPLDNSSSILVVLDSHNKYHVQLSQEISSALAQIDKLELNLKGR